jgi:hypothetical protein
MARLRNSLDPSEESSIRDRTSPLVRNRLSDLFATGTIWNTIVITGVRIEILLSICFQVCIHRCRYESTGIVLTFPSFTQITFVRLARSKT